MKYRSTKLGKKGRAVKRLVAATMVLVLLGGIAITVFKPAHAAADILFVSQSTASATAAASSLVVTAPAGIATGNLLIAEVMALPSTSSGVTITGPTGWSTIGTPVTSGKYKLSTFYHIVTASEPTSDTFSFSPASTAIVAIAAFSGTDTKSPVDVQNGQANTSSTTQTAPSVTTTYNTDMLFPVWAYQTATTASAFSGGLTSVWNTSAGSLGIAAGYKALTNSGSTGTYTTTTAAATAGQAQTIAIKPAAAAAGVQFVAATAPGACSSCTSQAEASPTGWKGGDFLITNVTWNGAVALSAPSGWTQINSTLTSGAYSSANFYRFAVTGDPTSYTWSFTGGSASSALVSTVDFSGVDPAAPIDVTATAVDASSVTNHVASSVTTNWAQDMLVIPYGLNNKNTVTSFTNTMTQIWNTSASNANGAVSVFGAYELQGVSGVTGTRTATTSSEIALMHTIALKAYLPTPNLISPVTGTTDSNLMPSFQLVSADLSGSPEKYKVQLCSTSSCSTIITTFDQTVSQTGWSGQDALSGAAYVGSTDVSSASTATFTVQSPLTACTQYWWRGLAFDTGFSQLGNPSNIFTFTTSCIPAPPTLYVPVSASGVPLHPEFQLASTDADADPLEYKIDLCTTNTCSSILATFDQTSTQTGWSGQDADTFNAYGSDPSAASNSTTAFYDYSSGTLSPNTQYWWRAYAIDPDGTNTWSSASTIQTFTTNLTETRILQGTIKQGKIL